MGLEKIISPYQLFIWGWVCFFFFSMKSLRKSSLLPSTAERMEIFTQGDKKKNSNKMRNPSNVKTL